MSKYLAVYERLCPSDPIAKDDSRRAAIIAEMAAIKRANTAKEAAAVIEWWGWNSPGDCTRWVNRARKLMGVK